MAAAIRVRIKHFTQKYVQTFLVPPNSFNGKPKVCFHNSSLLYVIGQELRMPSLSPTMSEGTIVKWLKQEGDAVAAGDVLCDIQTDKAVVSFEVDDEGILAKILVPENTKDIQVGTLIGLMVGEGEDWRMVERPPTGYSISLTTPGHDKAGGVVMGGGGGAASKPDPGQLSSFKTSILTSYGPAVRYLLARYDLKVNELSPTGNRGKLLKEDVLKYIDTNKLKEKPLKPVPLVSQAAAGVKPKKEAKAEVKKKAGAGFVEIEVTNMRKTIAKRLLESKTQIPHSFSTINSNIDELLKLRKQLKQDGIEVSVNDFIIKAAAHALQQYPEVNAHYTGDQVVYLPSIDISVAVATDAGLITPIVKDAASKGLMEISTIVRDLAKRAREGKLKLHEFQGGSFSVSNLGMFGIKQFSAIINPPQCAILAIGGPQDYLGENGDYRKSMATTLSFDSRAIDESLAAEFLQSVQSVLQNPSVILLGGHTSLRAKLGL